jgi:hypothetical protein
MSYLIFYLFKVILIPLPLFTPTLLDEGLYYPKDSLFYSPLNKEMVYKRISRKRVTGPSLFQQQISNVVKT